MYVIKLRIWSY